MSLGSAHFDDFLDASDNRIFQHDLYSVRMLGRLREDAMHNAFGELSSALVLLLNDAHAHTGLNLGSGWAIHVVIMIEAALQKRSASAFLLILLAGKLLSRTR